MRHLVDAHFRVRVNDAHTGILSHRRHYPKVCERAMRPLRIAKD